MRRSPAGPLSSEPPCRRLLPSSNDLMSAISLLMCSRFAIVSSSLTSVNEDETIAKREHINKLIADIKSLEEGNKRLQGGSLDKGPAGDRRIAFRGRGDRRYISALRVKGKRILVLLDTSASMM